jgi:uncharacterized tellurite resistance protein B-like protein
MPLLRLLTTLGLRADGPPPQARPFLVRLQQELGRLGAERLEYLAGFAGQLARVASAEGGISPDEAAAMAAQLTTVGGLAAPEASVIVDLVRHEFETLRSVQAHELGRAINDHASADEKLALVDCLYAVAAADHLVSDVEEQAIRRIAEALLVPHRVLMEIRARYRDRLEVLQALPRERR